MLICPKCQQKLVKENKSYKCLNRHTYDIAKQGYVNLVLGNQKVSGDSLEMVQARTLFLNQGYYQILQEKLVEIVKQIHPQFCVDLGCGEGYYTQAIAAVSEQCVGLDVSKEALKHASRNDKNTQYVLASIFHAPLADQSSDCIVNVFAPVPLDEIKRLLKHDGIYIKVGPAAKHLMGLKEVLYENVYENEVEVICDSQLELIHQIEINDEITLQNTKEIEALFMMTPYYWKTSVEDSERLLTKTTLKTRISFDIQIYQFKENY